MVIGIYMDEKRDTQRDDFLREEFSDIATAVAAFRHHDRRAGRGRAMSKPRTRQYTLRHLLPDVHPKPDWQKGLDDLMLAALSAPLQRAGEASGCVSRERRPSTNRFISGFRPITATLPSADNAATVAVCRTGATTRSRARRAAKAPHYAWSIAESDLEARTLEVLSWAQLRAGNPQAALDAIDAGLQGRGKPGPRRATRDDHVRSLSRPAGGSVRRRL